MKKITLAQIGEVVGWGSQAITLETRYSEELNPGRWLYMAYVYIKDLTEPWWKDVAGQDLSDAPVTGITATDSWHLCVKVELNAEQNHAIRQAVSRREVYGACYDGPH